MIFQTVQVHPQYSSAGYGYSSTEVLPLYTCACALKRVRLRTACVTLQNTLLLEPKQSFCFKIIRMITSFFPDSGGSRFSGGRGVNPPGGAPTYDFAKFSQNLHEVERIWTWGYYVDPPLYLPQLYLSG